MRAARRTRLLRKLIGLTTLLAALGVLGVPVASAEVDEAAPAGEAGAPTLIEPEPQSGEEEGAPTTIPPGAKSDGVTPAAASDCPPSAMCIWSGQAAGTFSWWPGYETGCHAHAANPSFLSFWNRTPYTVRLGGHGNVGPNRPSYEVSITGPIYGEVCWPV
jgi:hypothetical protein